MTKVRNGCGILGVLACLAFAGEKKMQFQDLPPAVQKSVQDQTKGGEIKGISKETEKGQTQYEVETILNGKHRDINFDRMGTVVAVEEETTLDSLPAAARTAIEKKVAGGKIATVETVTKGSTVFYEAAYTSKNGRKHEVLVKADGTETKD